MPEIKLGRGWSLVAETRSAVDEYVTLLLDGQHIAGLVYNGRMLLGVEISHCYFESDDHIMRTYGIIVANCLLCLWHTGPAPDNMREAHYRKYPPLIRHAPDRND